MKKILIFVSLAFFAGALIFACKKTIDSDTSFNRSQSGKGGSKALLTCTYETLSGHITSNRTLTATTIYKIDGCVTVDNGITLTIPAGTVLQGMKTSTSGAKSVLIVDRGGVINAVGTSTNPIVFTSDQAPGSRAPGDWVGLRLYGKANNSSSNSLTENLGCATYTGGGINNADNSGSLRYVQIHFAGQEAIITPVFAAALGLNSVGTGTTIDHIQITNSGRDGTFIAGGAVKLTYIVDYNADRTDFKISHGNLSQYQYLAALRLNNAAVPSTSAYGIDIVDATTNPKMNNITVLGPNHCSNTITSSNFIAAIKIGTGAIAEVRNSLFSGWKDAGLFLDGATTIGATATNNLIFSYNTFHKTANPASHSAGSWSSQGGCGNAFTTMIQWMNGTAPNGCAEAGYQLLSGTDVLDYNSSFCSDFCDSFTSDFTLGSGTDMLASNFLWDSPAKFDHPSYRGAFGTVDWTQNFSNWCAGSTIYCTP